jgi:hypothetical protein
MNRERLEAVLHVFELTPLYVGRAAHRAVYAVTYLPERFALGTLEDVLNMTEEEVVDLIEQRLIGLLLQRLRRYRVALADLAEEGPARGHNPIQFFMEEQKGDGA